MNEHAFICVALHFNFLLNGSRVHFQRSRSCVRNLILYGLFFNHSLLRMERNKMHHRGVVHRNTTKARRHFFCSRRECTCKPQALNNVIPGIIKCQANLLVIHFFLPYTYFSFHWFCSVSSDFVYRTAIMESWTRTLIKLHDWKIFFMFRR